MKILCVCPYKSSYSVAWKTRVNGILKAGQDVRLFDDRLPRIPLLKLLPPRGWGMLRNRVKSLRQIDINLMNKDLVETAAAWKPDLLLVEKGTTVAFDTVGQIKRMGITTAIWYIDNIEHLDWMQQAAKAYDYFFHFDSYVVSLLREEGSAKVYQTPFGCDPDLHKTITVSQEDRAKYGSDICIIGAYTPEREEIFQQLTDFDIKIWGYPEWRHSKVQNFYQGVITDATQMAKVYNASKIAINRHYKYTSDGATTRTFEIAACGGALQIVDYRKDILSYFEEGKEIIFFKDIDDLRRKIQFYLKNEEERKAIVRQAQQRAYKEHTLEKRMKDLISIVQQGEALKK